MVNFERGINVRIKKFKHDSDNGIIEFEVEHNGGVNKVEVEHTGNGTSCTDIGDFTENWTYGEYQQLVGFVDGCSNILHQFYR